MNTWQKALAVLLLCGFCFGMGRYLTPDKVIHEVEEKIVEVTKEVIKQVGKTQTHIIETIYPDGRKVTETFILDEKTVVIEKDKFNEIIKKEREVIENSKPNYQIRVGTGTKIDGFKLEYTVGIEKRVLGPIFAGAYGRTDKELGITLSMEF